MSLLFWIVVASTAVSLVSFVGVLFLIKRKFFSQNHITLLVSFAAGVMLTTAFFDMLPETTAGGEQKTVYSLVFVGIVFFFLLERFVLWFHHHDHGHGKKPSAILLIFGDAFHNTLDGVAIAAAFLTSPVLGVTTALAICAHEIPHEIGDFSVLVEGGFSRRKALIVNFCTGIVALIGAIAGFFFLEHIQHVTWIFLSFAAGMFIYIACADLIPELHKDFQEQHKWIQTLPFLLGIAILWSLIKILEG